MRKLLVSALRWAMVFGLLAAAFWGTWSLFAPVPTVSEIKIVAEYWTICIPVWPTTRLWDILGLALLAAGFPLSLWLFDLPNSKWPSNAAIPASMVALVIGLLVGIPNSFAYGLIVGLLIGIAIWLAVAFGVAVKRIVTARAWGQLWHWMNADQIPTAT